MRSRVTGGFYAALFSLLTARATAQTTTDTAIVDVGDAEDAVVYCDTCVKVDSICYNRSYLFDLVAPFRNTVVIKKMGILRDNNVLYYSFEPKLDDPESSKVAYVSLDSPESFAGVMSGPHSFNFTVFDINQNDNSIYLGGSDGVWVLLNANQANPTLKPFVSKGNTITNVVSKDYVYFSKDNSPGVIKNKNGIFDILLDDRMIKNFILDKDVEYTVVYLHSTGLYAFNSKSKEQVRLSINPFFRGLAVDLDGVIYAWHVYGLYKVTLDNDMKHSKLSRVSDLVVGAMTFDNLNNIIYTKDKSLYKLTKTNVTKC